MELARIFALCEVLAADIARARSSCCLTSYFVASTVRGSSYAMSLRGQLDHHSSHEAGIRSV
jgi:hypothetical protein